MSDHYILEGHMPAPCDLMTWARSFDDGMRRVAFDEFGIVESQKVKVSTVFLGLDHRWGEGPPLLFETMIFGGPHNEWQERCSTWQEAEAMHARACALVRESRGET